MTRVEPDSEPRSRYIQYNMINSGDFRPVSFHQTNMPAPLIETFSHMAGTIRRENSFGITATVSKTL